MDSYDFQKISRFNGQIKPILDIFARFTIIFRFDGQVKPILDRFVRFTKIFNNQVDT